MTLNQLAARCYREIKNSTSKEMLTVAWKYYRLFFYVMVNKKVSTKKINQIDTIIVKQYKRKQRQFER